MKRVTWCAIAALSFAASMSTHAADAYLTGNVNMRAGPDPGYPLIAQVQAGTEVDVQGCTNGWAWCDVIAYGSRGWVAGNFIQYEYNDQPVLLPEYGAQLGIPIIGFALGDYWGRFYRDRPFYDNRDYWYRQPFGHRPPPPPMHQPFHGQPGGYGHQGGYGQPGGYGHPQGYGQPGGNGHPQGFGHPGGDGHPQNYGHEGGGGPGPQGQHEGHPQQGHPQGHPEQKETPHGNGHPDDGH